MTDEELGKLMQQCWNEYPRNHKFDTFKFGRLVVAAEREKVAKWMIERGYVTGHGDTVEDLLKELEWQAKERELKACAEECEDSLYCAAVTRSRGNTGIKWEIEP